MKALLRNVILTALALPPAAMAVERNDLGSCYDRAKLSEYKPQSVGRQLVVVVDQTIPMPEEIQRAAWDKIERFVQPGDQVKLYSFSAFVPGEYMRLVTDVALDADVGEDIRRKMNMSRLRTLGQCFKLQKQQFTRVVGGQFVKVLRGASQDIPRSEIMYAMREIGKDMGRQQASERVMFLVSDMLEHSDYTTFYAKNQIQNLNVAGELKKAEDRGLFADLGGARVYVAGAGLVTDNIKHAYRSSKTMDLLNNFWSSYFQRSNASLDGFGTPMLNTELQ